MMLRLSVQWMVGCRLAHTAAKTTGISTANLGKLRKKTGFSITKCKNALEKFDNDIRKAEQWLRDQAQKEGWDKATKLQDRAMTQGLVGVLVDGRIAAMVEVNCETDFVARNQKFRGLVAQAASLCVSEGKNSSIPQGSFNREDIAALQAPHGKTLADLVAMEVGNIGENMAVRRGVYVQAQEGQRIGSYVHTADTKTVKDKCTMGKYGALVVFSQTDPPPEGALGAVEMGSQLGLHVVGMHPQTVGQIDPPPPEEDAPEDSLEAGGASAEDEGEEKKKKKPRKKKKKKNLEDDNETEMIRQMFIGDHNVTVAEFLEQNGATVDSFVRFQCGEQLLEEE